MIVIKEFSNSSFPKDTCTIGFYNLKKRSLVHIFYQNVFVYIQHHFE